MDIALHKAAVEWLETLSSSSGVQGTPKVVFHKVSAADWKELEIVFDVYDREIGGTPYLVCPGAGVYEPSVNGFWSDQDEDGHYKLLDLNLLGPIKLTRIAILKMLKHNQPGVIIHVSRTGAQKSSIITPLYGVAKHGISSFVRAMAPLHELAGIRVVGVAPGVVKSPLFLDHPEAYRFIDPEKDFMLPPEEVGRAMVVLATNLKYKPSTILEVTDFGQEQWREVQLLNDPGPQGRAAFNSRKQEAIKDVVAFLDLDRQSGQIAS